MSRPIIPVFKYFIEAADTVRVAQERGRDSGSGSRSEQCRTVSAAFLLSFQSSPYIAVCLSFLYRLPLVIFFLATDDRNIYFHLSPLTIHL